MGSYSDLNKGENVPVALLGRVPVKVSLENGEIKAGDALTSSTRKGYAAKAVKSGRIIGYAMEDYKTAANTEKIMVFVQPGWHQSEAGLALAPSADLGYQKINGSVIIRLG